MMSSIFSVMVSNIVLFTVVEIAQATSDIPLTHAGINIPPPPHNTLGDFFFNSSNAVSFSDAVFDYSGFEEEELVKLFSLPGSSALMTSSDKKLGYGFNSARIQVNTKTGLKKWYLDETSVDKVFSNSTVLFKNAGSNIPTYLIEPETNRIYVSPLQAVEYVVASTNTFDRSQPRRAILNFCGTCTGCTDGNIPPPNIDDHGSGTIDDCPSFTQAWMNIADYFSAERFKNDDLHFELLNEPHTLDIPNDKDRRTCMVNVAARLAAKFGADKIIWPADSWEDHAAVTYDYMNSAQNQQNPPVVPNTYDIGWHIYPWTCKPSDGESQCTVDEYENWVLNEAELPYRNGSLPKKVWLTEFGGALYDNTTDYFNPMADSASGGGARQLKGIANLLGQKFAANCAQVRGVFWWHGGYFFDDSYTVDSPTRPPDGKNGASMISKVMTDLNSEDCRGCTESPRGDVCEIARCAKCRIGEAPSVEAAGVGKEDADVVMYV